MMAFIPVNYDLKPEHDGVRPESVYHGLAVYPNETAKVLFKKRSVDCLYIYSSQIHLSHSLSGCTPHVTIC